VSVAATLKVHVLKRVYLYSVNNALCMPCSTHLSSWCRRRAGL